MADGYFRVKIGELIAERDTNLHRVSQKGEVSYPTLHRYNRKAKVVEGMTLRVLYGFLVRGLGIDPEDLADMRFGDVFEIVSETNEPEEK